mmetsp:Transcript_68339/g.211759  ORF Transcript_68339/g.211759 Transcript_68339/m.211759 type:complete len:131 (+) Transcript_68339:3-395(+)
MPTTEAAGLAQAASAAVVQEASTVLAGLSAAELESPQRSPAAAAAEPGTPAASAPPKVPPSTPMTVAEAGPGEAVCMMSPSVVRFPESMEGRPGAPPDSPAPGRVSFESPPPAPGVIYETPAQRAAAALL